MGLGISTCVMALVIATLAGAVDSCEAAGTFILGTRDDAGLVKVGASDMGPADVPSAVGAGWFVNATNGFLDAHWIGPGTDELATTNTRFQPSHEWRTGAQLWAWGKVAGYNVYNPVLRKGTWTVQVLCMSNDVPGCAGTVLQTYSIAADGNRDLKSLTNGRLGVMRELQSVKYNVPYLATVHWGMCLAITDGSDVYSLSVGGCNGKPTPGGLTCKASVPPEINLGSLSIGEVGQGDVSTTISCSGGDGGAAKATVTFTDGNGHGYVGFTPSTLRGELWAGNVNNSGELGYSKDLLNGDNTVPIGVKVTALAGNEGTWQAAAVVKVVYQ